MLRVNFIYRQSADKSRVFGQTAFWKHRPYIDCHACGDGVVFLRLVDEVDKSIHMSEYDRSAGVNV